MAEEQYYALCVEDEEGTTEVVYFELGEGAMGALGMSVYTAPDGELQCRHLEDVDVIIAPKSREELLDAMHTGVPGSVYVDGERISGSVFKARLKDALGIPVRQPRVVRLDPDPESVRITAARGLLLASAKPRTKGKIPPNLAGQPTEQDEGIGAGTRHGSGGSEAAGHHRECRKQTRTTATVRA